MQIISSIQHLRERLKHEPSIAFVPTMGNLHNGHSALVELAKRHGKCVVASIFVNPMQFGPGEDFEQYPRTFEADCARLEALGVDVVFHPEAQELFPVPQQFMVDPPSIANELCGAHRPGHFRGVVTIVLKLCNIVQPNVAIFGKKDYQQLHLVRAMVKQLNLPLRIIAGETVRAADGLALSSRNSYLSTAERAEATRLCQNLSRLKGAILAGADDFQRLEQSAALDLAAHGWRVDYVSVRTQQALAPAQSGDKELVVLAAAWLGNTRLIDNVEVCVEAGQAL